MRFGMLSRRTDLSDGKPGVDLTRSNPFDDPDNCYTITDFPAGSNRSEGFRKVSVRGAPPVESEDAAGPSTGQRSRSPVTLPACALGEKCLYPFRTLVEFVQPCHMARVRDCLTLTVLHQTCHLLTERWVAHSISLSP
jgi:hypothetical protein